MEGSLTLPWENTVTQTGTAVTPFGKGEDWVAALTWGKAQHQNFGSGLKVVLIH